MKSKQWFLVVLFFLSITALLAGCGKTSDKMDEKEKIVGDSTLVRDRNIDVASLDKNSDGFVYQCPMHTNVVSDNNGQCSYCMMDLEQGSVAEVQKSIKEDKPHTH